MVCKTMYGGSNPPGTSEESLEVVCNERFKAFFVLFVCNSRRVVGRFAVFKMCIRDSSKVDYSNVTVLLNDFRKESVDWFCEAIEN